MVYPPQPPSFPLPPRGGNSGPPPAVFGSHAPTPPPGTMPPEFGRRAARRRIRAALTVAGLGILGIVALAIAR